MIEGYFIDWVSVAAFVAAGAAIASAIISARMVKRNTDVQKNLKLLELEDRRTQQVFDALSEAITCGSLANLLSAEDPKSKEFLEKELSAVHRLSLLAALDGEEGMQMIKDAYRFTRGPEETRDEAMMKMIASAQTYLNMRKQKLVGQIEKI